MRPQLRHTLSVYRTLQSLGPAPLQRAGTEPLEQEPRADLGGRYRLEGLIGEGATSRVYRGRHLRMDQAVAIKMLRPELCADPDAVKRFLDEARTLARLRHPNIVHVQDFDLTDSCAWMVMELLEGETLADRRDRLGRLGWSSVKRIMLQLCSALRAAHAQGVVHRDIKPENCVCLPSATDRDFIKIVDFGISATFAGGRVSSLEPRGLIAGTPAYMAPERMLGGGDERSDVYSTGVVMYELLTGSLPFEGVLPTTGSRSVTPPSERAPGCCSREVDRVVLRAIASLPGDRYQSMRELAEAVRRAGECESGKIAIVAAPPPVRYPPRRPVAKPRVSVPLPEPAIVVATPTESVEPEITLGERSIAIPPKQPRSRSRAAILFAATAGVALALGVSPFDAHAVIEPAPTEHSIPSIHTEPSESAIGSERSSIAVPRPFAEQRWCSECVGLAGR